MRQELFRTLLMGKIEFFDAHSTSQLTSLISVEMDTLRSFVFGNVSRDRGARAILEAVGSVLVRAPAAGSCLPSFIGCKYVNASPHSGWVPFQVPCGLHCSGLHKTL